MRRRAGLLVLMVTLAGPTYPQDRPLPELESFIARARAHLQTDQRLQSQYTYLERRSEIHLTKLGKLTAGPEKVYEVYPGIEPIQTYRRLVEVDGKPRNQAELDREDRDHRQNVLELLKKREQESAGDREKRLKRRERERAEEEKTFDELLHVYAFTLVGREMIAGPPVIVIDFAPKSDAAPKTDNGKLMLKVKGRVWVSEDDYEIARVEIEMIDDLSVGWGIVGKLYRGSTASFERRKINDEVWLPAEARFSGTGRAFVRRFRIDTIVRYSEYRKYSVETDTTFGLPETSR